MEKDASKRPMTVSADGNVVACGMLYDCRTEQFIPGLRLEYETISTTPCQKIENGELMTDQEIREKEKQKNTLLGLKFKSLAGLDYGNPMFRKSSEGKQKMFLDSYMRTKNEKAFFYPHGRGSEKNKHIISYGLGTHVVAEIDYGAKIVFCFELEKSEVKRNETNNITAGLSGLLNGSLSLSGSRIKSESEVEALSKIKFKFTSDFIAKEMPKDFQECMKFYKEISQHVGDGIPHQIHLLPLSIFEVEVPSVLTLDQELASHTVELRHILAENINDCRVLLDDWDQRVHSIEVKKEYSDENMLLKSQAFNNEVKAVIGLASKWYERFGVKCSQTMVNIEGGKCEREDLEDLIKLHERSPFQEDKFDVYLQTIAAWKDVLFKCHEMITFCKKNVIKVYADKPEAMDFVMNQDTVVCFKLVMPKKSQFQADMYYTVHQSSKYTEGLQHQDDNVHRDIEAFKKFAEKSSNIKCIFYLSFTRQPSNFPKHILEVYHRGNLVSGQDFKLPFKVAGFCVKNISNCSAEIGWDGLENCKGETYGVKLTQCHTKECVTYEEHTIKKMQKYVHLNSKLNSNTKYKVEARLQADTVEHFKKQEIVDEGCFAFVWCEPYVFKTLHNEPELTELNDKRFRMTWKNMDKANNTWKVQVTKENDETIIDDCTKETKFEFSLEGDGGYQISLSAFDEKGKCQERYKSISKQIENSNQLQNLRAELKNKSTLQSKGKPTVYLLPMRDVEIRARPGKQVGAFRPYMEERIVLVLGTSSGDRKGWTNLLVSSLLGVEAVHEYYFDMPVEMTSPQGNTTYSGSGFLVYRICQVDGFHFPFTLTVIETANLSPEVLKSSESLHKHIRIVQDKLGPKFNHLDGITFVLNNNLDSEKTRKIETTYQSKCGKPVEITFITHDRPEEHIELEIELQKQADYLEKLTDCKDTKCRRLRYRLWHACDLIQNSLIQLLQRSRLLDDLKTNEAQEFTQCFLKPKYEELLPGHKALNCMTCLSTCQPYCTNEEITDIKKCVVFLHYSIGPSKCSVCLPDCGIKNHRLEDRRIAQVLERVKAVPEDPFEAVTKAIEHFNVYIRNGLKIFKEMYPQQTSNDFCSHLFSFVYEDDKALKDDCLIWLKKQKEDPKAMQLWEL